MQEISRGLLNLANEMVMLAGKKKKIFSLFIKSHTEILILICLIGKKKEAIIAFSVKVMLTERGIL